MARGRMVSGFPWRPFEPATSTLTNDYTAGEPCKAEAEAPCGAERQRGRAGAAREESPRAKRGACSAKQGIFAEAGNPAPRVGTPDRVMTALHMSNGIPCVPRDWRHPLDKRDGEALGGRVEAACLGSLPQAPGFDSPYARPLRFRTAPRRRQAPAARPRPAADRWKAHRPYEPTASLTSRSGSTGDSSLPHPQHACGRSGSRQAVARCRPGMSSPSVDAGASRTP